MTDDQPTAGAPPEADSQKPSTPIDWERRFKDSQAAFTRKATEAADLRRRLEALEAGYETDDDGDEEVPDRDAAPVLSRFRTAERPRPQVPEERAISEQVYGPEVLDAFGRASALLSAAVTEADRVSALEAYHQLRERATSSARRPEPPAGGRPTRDQMVTPTVQTNRPDGPMDVDETDPALYTAGANGGLRGFVLATLNRRGQR